MYISEVYKEIIFRHFSLHFVRQDEAGSMAFASPNFSSNIRDV